MSTIAKVAEKAGVSPTTVSHVLNHADRVSKAMRDRVQSAIDELGYVPNRQAQSLRTGRTNIIAMLIVTLLCSKFLWDLWVEELEPVAVVDAKGRPRGRPVDPASRTRFNQWLREKRGWKLVAMSPPSARPTTEFSPTGSGATAQPIQVSDGAPFFRWSGRDLPSAGITSAGAPAADTRALRLCCANSAARVWRYMPRT